MAQQPFEQYPALASWIERMGNTGSSLSLGDWMVFIGALNSALITAARRPDHIVGADDMVGGPALPDREAVGEMDNAALDEHRAWLAAQLLDDVFFAYPKITAMAKELSEAQAGEMRAIAREVYERLRAETAEAQRDAALEALRPFAEAEKLTNPHDRVAVVNVSDLRAASRAGGGE